MSVKGRGGEVKGRQSVEIVMTKISKCHFFPFILLTQERTRTVQIVLFSVV